MFKPIEKTKVIDVIKGKTHKATALNMQAEIEGMKIPRDGAIILQIGGSDRGVALTAYGSATTLTPVQRSVVNGAWEQIGIFDRLCARYSPDSEAEFAHNCFRVVTMRALRG